MVKKDDSLFDQIRHVVNKDDIEARVEEFRAALEKYPGAETIIVLYDAASQMLECFGSPADYPEAIGLLHGGIAVVEGEWFSTEEEEEE